jgi:5'-nucleotidase
MAKPGHFELYSTPSFKPEKSSRELKHVVLVATNNLEAKFLPQIEQVKLKDGKEVSIKVGGTKVLNNYVSILRKKFPKQVLLVDAGGSLSSEEGLDEKQARAMLRKFQIIGYDAISLATNDFIIPSDVSQASKDVFKRVFKNNRVPVITSNLIDVRTGKPFRLKNFHSSRMVNVNGVKVGLIGVVTPSIINKVKGEDLNGLYFKDSKDTIVWLANSLRKKGANIIVMMLSAEGKCGEKFARENDIPIEKANFITLKTDLCSLEDEAFTLIKSLAPNLIDAAVLSSNNSKVANYINGIPVIQTFGDGKYFSRVDLFVDSTHKKVITSQTKIHQPTKLCSNFFKSSRDCFHKDPIMDYSQTEPAKFLNETINQNL